MAAVCGLKVQVSTAKAQLSLLNCLLKLESPKLLRNRKNNMSFPKHLECNLCGNQQPYEPFTPAVCKKCDSQWLEARYDYDAFKRDLLRGLPNRPSNMWRYQ